MKFNFSSGQRVLDGYTLKRGIGRGGFGEVYYALSDGGKEVALKLVRGENLDVELRGMAQCLNLKHPNLLTLYDLKTDPQGDHWVIMEYIAGEPLSIVLNRHPRGLPPELAQQWFLTLARAVGYLHDHGIVHRDLKPGNIFIENGTVKVGDYGLCKFISCSQRTAQTQSVGTVHYMAPEISAGNYGKQVDVYSAGIILYEMLTGRVPFEGESAGEILMKHLTSPPDLAKLPPDFVNVVGKALAKDPAHRYVTIADMARAVEGVTRATGNEGSGRPVVLKEVPRKRPGPVPGSAPAPQPVLTAVRAISVRDQVAELCGSLALTPVVAAFFTTMWMSVSSLSAHGPGNGQGFPIDLSEVGLRFFLTVAICWAVLIPAKFWNGRPGDAGLRRAIMMIMGILIGLGTLWVEGWSLDLPSGAPQVPRSLTPPQDGHDLFLAARYLTYFGLAFFAIRWWKMADRYRRQRFSLAPILAAGFWALVLLPVWPWPQAPHGAIALVLASVIIQLISPWEQAPSPLAKRMRLRYA